ncbi:MAG: hypothetical protein A2168_04770 [Planctomycetes bacterium RBG_13_50_24]|nr:MAG: hypothetical protein A2168_04770 [Planctomycetes bacterium RBG_13_50_24]
MKRVLKHLSNGKYVDLESQESDIWEDSMRNQYAQTLRNTGRIEQLEAGQADIRELVKAILSQRWPSHRAVVQYSHITPPVSWSAFAESLDIIEKQHENVDYWSRIRADMEDKIVVIERTTLPFEEKLSAIKILYCELEENFAEIPHRVALCAVMEKELAAVEELLEGEEIEYLAWCVSLVRDVLDYNYAETLESSHLKLLEKAIDLICNKGMNCDKEDYRGLHKEFLESRLTLVPISQKAIDNYED